MAYTFSDPDGTRSRPKRTAPDLGSDAVHTFRFGSVVYSFPSPGPHAPAARSASTASFGDDWFAGRPRISSTRFASSPKPRAAFQNPVQEYSGNGASSSRGGSAAGWGGCGPACAGGRCARRSALITGGADSSARGTAVGREGGLMLRGDCCGWICEGWE